MAYFWGGNEWLKLGSSNLGKKCGFDEEVGGGNHGVVPSRGFRVAFALNLPQWGEQNRKTNKLVQKTSIPLYPLFVFPAIWPEEHKDINIAMNRLGNWTWNIWWKNGLKELGMISTQFVSGVTYKGKVMMKHDSCGTLCSRTTTPSADQTP